MGSKGSMTAGERGRRERFSRNGCTLPSQVYYMEFQEAQVQREFLVMLDISRVHLCVNILIFLRGSTTTPINVFVACLL